MSINAKEEEKREKFRNMLVELSKSKEFSCNPSERVQYYKMLEDIYYPDLDGYQFKHYYSDIFSVLTEIHRDRTGDGNIDTLGYNVKLLKENYCAKTLDADGRLIDVSNQIRKLYDHLSLDIARISYSDLGDDALSQETNLRSIDGKIAELSQAVQSTKSQSDEINEKLDKSQKEYIAILGIFSAVVLAFTAGIAFSSSVLQNMHSSSIYRILIVSLTIGLVTVNVIYLLLDFIVTMTASRHTPQKPKKQTWLIINGIIISLMLCVAVSWLFGLTEKRTEHIEREINSVKSEEPQNISVEE